MAGTSTLNYTRHNDALLLSFGQHWRARGLAHTTGASYVKYLRAWSVHLGKSFTLATRQDIESYVGAEIERTSANTGRMIVRAIRALFRFLVEQEEIETNPAAKVRSPRVDEPVTKIVSDEDIAAMLATCKNKHPKKPPRFSDLRDAAVILTLACSGMRVGEMSRLVADDVDLVGGTVQVRKSKSGKQRLTYLDPPATKALRRYLLWSGIEGGQALWRSRNEGAPLSLNGLQQLIVRRARMAGCSERVSPHQFRRQLASSWLRAGGSETGLMSVAGWSSSAMIAKYTRAHRAELAQAEFRRLRG